MVLAPTGDPAFQSFSNNPRPHIFQIPITTLYYDRFHIERGHAEISGMFADIRSRHDTFYNLG